MADFSYSALEVLVNANTRGLEANVKDSATKAGAEAGQQISSHLSRGLSRVAPIAGKIGKSMATGLGIATTAAVAFGVKSFEAASKVQAMGASLDALAKANHVSTESVNASVESLVRMGQSTEDAQALVANLVREHISLAKATDLGRIAQNASVVTGKSVASTETAITKAIATGNASALKRAGIMIDSKTALDNYAASIGKTTAELTPAEKSQAVLNAVIKAGGPIAGAWAAQLKTPAGAIRALKHEADELTISVGTVLVKALTPAFAGLVKLGEAVSADLAPGGRLAPIVNAIAVAAARTFAPLSKLITLMTGWLDHLDPAKLNTTADAIKRWGPALAAAGAAAAIFTGSGLLGNLPVVGPMLENLLGPLHAVQGAVVSVAKAAVVQMVPALEGAVGEADGLGAALGGMAAPAALAAGGFALLLAVSPQFRAAMLQIAHALLAAVTPALVELAGSFRVLIPPIVQVAKVLGGALAVALLAVVPLIQALGAVLKFIGPALGPLITGFLAVRTAVVLWTAAQWLLNAALDANPIGLVILALGALTLAFVTAWNHSATFRRIVEGAWHGILAAAQAVWGWIRANWPLLVGMLAGPFGVAAALIAMHWRAIRAFAVSTWNYLASFITRITGTIQRTISSAMASIHANVTRTFTAIRSTVTAILNGIRAYIVATFNADRAIISAAMSAIKSVISSGFNAARRAVTSAVAAIRSLVTAGFNASRSAVSSAMGGIRSVLSSGFATARRTVASAVSSMLGSVRNMAAGFAAAGRSAIGNLLRGMTSALSGIDGWVKVHIVDPVVNAVKRYFGIRSPSQVMAGVGENVSRGFVEGIARANPLSMAKTIFGGIPAALGHIVAKGLVSVASLPGRAISALSGLGGRIGGLLSKIPGVFGFGGGGPSGGGVAQWSGLMHSVLAHFGIPNLFATFMTQMQTESGGNPRAINLWDANAKAGIPSQGLMQVVPPTFAAYAGPYFSRGIMDPLANIYAAVAYAVARYGRNIGAVLGHGHGYAKGGVISEPITGFGMRSGHAYFFGERGPELVSPLSGRAGLNISGGRLQVTVNVYPQRGQSEVEIAAAVSRRLAWAVATGKA